MLFGAGGAPGRSFIKDFKAFRSWPSLAEPFSPLHFLDFPENSYKWQTPNDFADLFEPVGRQLDRSRKKFFSPTDAANGSS